jgi:hypothetical protein
MGAQEEEEEEEDDDDDEACAVIKIMHALTNQLRTYSQQTSAKKHD